MGGSSRKKKYYRHHIDSSKWIKIWKAAEEANVVSKKLNKDLKILKKGHIWGIKDNKWIQKAYICRNGVMKAKVQNEFSGRCKE